MSSPSSKFSVDGTSPSSPSSTRSGYPFPETLPRQSASNKYHPRRGSTASNTSIPSIGGTLDTQNRRGSTVRETSQNAISTLLQPPIVRTGLLPHTAASTAAAGYRAPTTKDIPPVALTNIPHIPPENFRDYLNRIGPLFESFQRGKSEPEQQPQWLKKDKELEKTDRFAQALERRMSNARDGGMMSPTTPLTPLETPGGQRRSSANPRRNRNEPTPLSTIPNVYFDENFHLENPRTFDVVSERAEIVRPPPGTPQPDREKGANGAPLPPRKALATNAILQEKMSWYMDTVEVHLINSISTASSGFFAALGSLKELQTEAEESVAKIQRLRADLRSLDQAVAVAGLEVAAKRRRRANLGKLGRAMGQVGRVVEEVKRADEMVEGGEFEAATEQMDRVGRLVCGQNSEPGDDALIDLRPLRALQGLDTGLQELQLRIGTGFANRFTSLLLTDLRQHVAKVPSSDTLKRWSRQRGIPPTYLDSTPQFRADLLSALRGLQRAGHISPATTAYREAVTKEMKAIIRKYLPSSNDDDADSMVSTATSRTGGGAGKLSQAEKSSILARNLRALDGEDAEVLLKAVYTDVGEALRRVSTQTKVLLDVSSSMLSPPTESQQQGKGCGGGGHSRNSSLAIATGQLTSRPGSSSGLDENNNAAQNPSRPGSEDHALDLTSSLLGLAVDTAQTQITRVLKVRNEATIRLPKELFLRYFTLNRLFADECEAISGRGGQGLKGIINAQIQGFVQVLGTRETERVRDLLEGERWEAEDFGGEGEVVLGRILGSMGSDPLEWGQGVRPIWEDAVADAANGGIPSLMNGTAATPNGQPPSKAPPAKPAYIDSTRYILVPSARALLPAIETFLSLTSVLGPSLTPQIATALLDVLRTFNSRSCQLILGAGATRSAGLKNITTKHLALASQALSFVGALVPYARECVRRHLGSAGGGGGGVLAEFDKVKRLLQEHQGGIHEKLVEIMTGRSGAHVKALLAMDFSSEKDEGKASAYMETLTKETLTLYRVLGKFLHEGDLFMIMRQIGEVYRGQWIKAFGEVDVRGAEKRLLRDAEVFEQRLGKIEGFEGVGRDVLAVVKGRMEEEEKG
ncbi:hypothetical protein LTR37_013755 [Vermiconidia calcicola]|uniref:Uncharacterized protein n=1 Tax=Vermiconidia calcicola TaxID=1690605 RepID=A0ACC3MWT9_9PEZI|nr:hypothetical protein LTR37_013755 [Vermiconidia calcicola]